MTLRITLKGRPELSTIIDDDDLEIVAGHIWRAVTSPTARTFYARTTVHGRNVYMHRLILGVDGTARAVQVDHIDGDSLNNARSNLRVSTQSQNNMNQVAKRSASGFKGVAPWGRGFRARGCLHGKAYLLGTYANAEDAARAYDAFARQRFGEFARLNFPSEGERGCIVHPPGPFDREEYLEARRKYKREYRARRTQAAITHSGAPA